PDPSLVQAVQHSLHPRELEITIARLPTTPRRLPDPHHCDASLLHHLDIFVEPVMGHVFRVVSDTVEDGVHLVGSEGWLALSRRALRQTGHRAGEEKEDEQERDASIMKLSVHVGFHFGVSSFAPVPRSTQSSKLTEAG